MALTVPGLAALKTEARKLRLIVNPDPWPAHQYEPHGSAATAFAATDREVLVAGPAGTGKSRGILEKLHRLCLDHPGIRVLLVRKTRESLTESGLVTYEEHVLGSGHPLTTGPQRRNRQSYQYPNGSVIVVGGLDKSSKIMSTEYDVIYPQEATELDLSDWEDLTTRLRNGRLPFQQIIGDCNPGPPSHWLKQRADSGKTRMIAANHKDNPRLFNHERQDWTAEGVAYLATLAALTGVRRARLLDGIWAAAEGMVYENFDPSIHLIDRFDIPADWRRFRVIDFGYRNPFVCQWWALDPDGALIRYRELYVTGRIVADLGKQITDLTGDERIASTIADHDAEDRATLRAKGIETVAAKKQVKRGIEAVQQRLRVDARDRAGLYFMRDSAVVVDATLKQAGKPISTEQEIEGYVWSDKATKEEPVKEDDHGMDATRYMVAHLDLTPKRQDAAGSVSFGPFSGARGRV